MQVRLEKVFKEHNLVIRTATNEDVNSLLKWWNDGKVMEHAGFPNGLGIDEKRVLESIARSNAEHQLLIMEFDGLKIGEMNYTLKDKIASFGIKICEQEFQEKGIGTVLLNMLFEHLFDDKKCLKITCDTNLNNERAQNVYENKMNMKKVKVLKDCFKNQLGQLQSAVLFEIEKNDYERMKTKTVERV